ncbi:MAG: hypothetical protein JWR63_366 [Conexibacter sp.]|nr:hypothetical protein [Conexibacter sp.]
MPEHDPLPVPRRAELVAPYQRPLRHVAGAAWRTQPTLRRWTAVAVPCVAVGTIGAVAGQPLLWLLAGAGGMLAAFVLAGWAWTISTASWRLRRSWSRRSELGTVRERRPHAGARDPEIAHDEFAVTAEDEGHLVTWRFRPLAISARPRDGELEIPGRPRYAASPVGDEPFDVEDAARAAEQLVLAQDRAAAREEAAVTAACDGAERQIEARSTAAALQRTTGQRSRRD